MNEYTVSMRSNLTALFAQRAHLLAEGTTIYRAAHTTETGGVFALDVAGEVGVLNLYQALSASEEQSLAQQCAQVGKLMAVYVKRRPVEARHLANVARQELSPSTPLWGEPCTECTALENGIPFLIRPAADLSIGLFTDARNARAWVRQHAPTRVLNTFAYTCGFGLNAAIGGSQTVKNIDLSRKVLAWGQENYALSDVAAPEGDFLYGDVFDWLRRLTKRGDQFDLVVLDPPSFSRGKGKIWKAERDYGLLVSKAAQITSVGGQLMVLLNHAGVGMATLERQVQSGLVQAGRTGQIHTRLGVASDYPGANHLKVQIWQLN